MVRIPVNGGEMNQFIAKQVLDIGVYGIFRPHISTVEEARNAVAGLDKGLKASGRAPA